jgi:alpha-glucosidase (family GH31 glycosyl hydrolase)
VIEIAPGLTKIPLFVKDGGIIPMIPPVLHTPTETEKLPLTVRHYGKNGVELDLCLTTTGKTFDYDRGQVYLDQTGSQKEQKRRTDR